MVWGAVQEAGHPLELAGVVERAVVGLCVGRTSGGGALGLLGQRRGEVGSDAGLRDHPSGGGAVLAALK